MDRLKRKLNCLLIQNQEEGKPFDTDHQIMGIEWVGRCQSVDEARSILGYIQLDLVFVMVDQCTDQDIQDIKLTSEGARLVLLTVDPAYQISHLDERVFDCLILPLSSGRLALFSRRMAEHYAHQTKMAEQEKDAVGPAIIVKSGPHQYRLRVEDIIFVESDGEYLKYHTQKGRYLALGSLRRLARSLSNDFVQVHRSYVVNRNYVIAKRKTQLELTGKVVIPIGKTYRNAFQFVSSAVLL